MRYLYLLPLFVGSLSFSQITVSNNDLPAVNDIFVLSIGTPGDVSNPEITGANYFWDFSTLSSNNQRVDTILAVSSTPFAYQYYFNNGFQYPDHKADFAIRTNMEINNGFMTVEDVINFYALDAGSYRQVGFGAKINGIPGSVRYNPTDSIHVLPLQYNMNYSSLYSYEIDVPNTFYFREDGVRIDTVDGWGTVETPYGVFDVLRVKSLINREDSAYVNAVGVGSVIPRPQDIEYKWIATGEGIPVLTVTRTGGNVSRVEYLDSLNTTSLLESGYDVVLSIYPNPSKGILYFDNTDFKSADVFVYNASGQLVLKKQMVNFKQLDVSFLETGSYFLRIFDGEQIYFSRFVRD